MVASGKLFKPFPYFIMSERSHLDIVKGMVDVKGQYPKGWTNG